jgi:aminoglycoside phosphotransferase (APT) family kinase protein
MSHALTPQLICDKLRTIGFRCLPHDVRIEPREERYLIRLPDNHVAWFAQTDAGRRLLDVERRVLKLLESRCAFAAPRILHQAGDGEFDIRKMVPGSVDAEVLYRRIQTDAKVAVQIGRALGKLLAEQHLRVTEGDIGPWLPRQPGWPEPREWIETRLARTIDDSRLRRDIGAVIGLYEQLKIAPSDCALTHNDIGFHNLAFDRDSLQVRGIFDYEGAAWSDRHHDFRYLLFDFDDATVLDAALSVYEPATGRRIDRQRVQLYNAMCAITFLAYRDGVAPNEKWCGRTLAEDLRWVRHATNKTLSRASLALSNGEG